MPARCPLAACSPTGIRADRRLLPRTPPVRAGRFSGAVSGFGLALLLCLPMPQALAEWMRFGVTEGGDVHYIDVDTLKRSGPRRVQFWARIELARPTYGMETRSVRMLVEHDCLLRKQRSLKVTYFTGANFSGSADSGGQGEWVDINQNTMGADLHGVVCAFR